MNAAPTPAVVLQDLLELTHTLTRLRSVPALKDDPTLTEGERSRGAALAEKLSVPVLGRAWQMLLKGLAEVNEAPDRRAAAEMVLIRLAHVAELPTPGDLVRRLTGWRRHPGRRPARPGAEWRRRPAGDGRQWDHGRRRHAGRCGRRPGPGPAAGLARRGGAGLRPEADAARASGPQRPPRALRPRPDRDAGPARRAARPRRQTWPPCCGELTGTRWTIALSNAEGEPTLAQQGRAADAERRGVAQSHPLVQAVLAAFPGAVIEAVRDAGADAYGLVDAGPAAAPPEPEDAAAISDESEPADYDDVPPPDDDDDRAAR